MTAQPKRLKVFLLGDSCIDEYVYVVKKQNPECDTDLLTVVSDHMRKLGMAENVAGCLENLGISVTPCMPTDPFDMSLKTRYVDVNGNTVVRIDHDRRPSTQPQLVRTVNLNSYDAVVISDYNKGWVTTDTINYVIQHFSGPIFLDTKKKNLEEFAGCVIKINEKEYSQANYFDDAMYVTCGERGCFHNGIEFPTLEVGCIDPCGAGDAFLAGLVYGSLQNTMRPAVHYALVCGAISTTYLGTYQPTLLELEQGLVIYDAQQGYS